MRSEVGSAVKKQSLLLLALAAFVSSASAQSSRWNVSLVGGANIGTPGISPFDIQSGDGSSLTASTTQSFTGLNGAGATQTMTFSGSTTTSSEFGRLRSRTSGTLSNSYYNANNPKYADGNGGVANAGGSPDSLTSLGFAGFDDTLHYGGELQNGYKARYLFHVDGFNSGTGYLADLAVQIGDDTPESFFAYADGYNEATWATVDHEINGIIPESIHVQFSNQVVFDTPNLTDGGTYSGLCDFSSTLTLAGIEVRDANGNLVSGWTVTSDSGTVYPVPEPATFAILAGGLLALRRRRR